MNRVVFLFLFYCFSNTAKAQYAGYKPVADIGQFKTQFATASQKIKSIRCDFVQEKNLSLLSEKIVSKGKFLFKKENKVRMEYVQPFKYLMIINNNNVYIKDGNKENKVSAKSNKLFQQINRLMIDCVNGTALNNPDFSVKAFESNTAYLIELTPVAKNLKPLFKNINITVDKKDYSASRIEMKEQSGDNTIIDLINKELNANLPDELFAAK
jgi:outer membrane lipoprotein-sorting protein